MANRDPLGEFGFEAVMGGEAPVADTSLLFREILEGSNLYRFAANAPTIRWDRWGLALSKADCDAFLKNCMKNVYKGYAKGGIKGFAIGLGGAAAGLALGVINPVAGVCVGGAVEVYGAIEAGGDINDARNEAKRCKAVHARCMAAVEKRDQR
jgi:hypothetical protein